MGQPVTSRRRILQLAGSSTVLGLAGCAGGGGGEGEELPEGVTEETFQNGPVPAEYRTATSQAGEERREDLVAKQTVQFQEASEAVAAGLADEGQNCATCAEFIPDRNGDGFGACARVQGYVGAEDWCTLWESIEEA